jgi:hypothetical protein
MQAGLIHEGQTVLLEYGPQGKPKMEFKGILRKEGVDVDGKVMSLSAAAVYCIQKTGSKRPTANGWIMWKTTDGTYLNDFYDQVYPTAAGPGSPECQSVATATAQSAGQG